MIKYTMLFLIVALLSAQAISCEIHLPEHMVILGDHADLTSSATHTACTEEVLIDLNETLKSVDGKISHFQLSGFMKNKNHDVQIRPNLINVQHLKSLIREQMMLPSGVHLNSSEAVNSPDFITLNYGEKVEVACPNCLFGSQQPLNVSIQGLDGNTRTLTVRADFRKMVKAYKVTTFHPAFSDIQSSSLKEEYVEVIPHTDLVTNLETLKFYKLNKPVRPGELLRQADLNPLSLVKAGMKTDVIIENNLVKLITSGISRSNGYLGEYVEVFHPQKNKKYQGKVIDINKVLVEL